MIMCTLHPIRTRPSEEFRLASRRLSLEFPIADTSFDVYYGERGVGVPFLWESRPGTPKINTAKYRIPPLTPPPSFHASPNSNKPSKKQPRNNLLILPRLKKVQPAEHSPSGSTSSSSLSSPLNESNRYHMAFDSRVGARIQEDECESPVSTLCFGRGASRGGGARSPGCSTSIIRLLLREFS
ncbi:hypothetical protein SASPL_105147 [Salvia splendens]|uniref:Uncharacterized protein n=1 Tax=Salvia splendens TaxID=180675 RepID=A0A8X8YPX8_SALSN|nr:hypothetical protein SASPL_105147 [Salvia splendens]